MGDVANDCKFSEVLANRDLLDITPARMPKLKELVETRGYEPLFAAAYLEASSLPCHVSGDRHEWNERQAAVIHKRYRERIDIRREASISKPTI